MFPESPEQRLWLVNQRRAELIREARQSRLAGSAHDRRPGDLIHSDRRPVPAHGSGRQARPDRNDAQQTDQDRGSRREPSQRLRTEARTER
jgi:hypothetical protein